VTDFRKYGFKNALPKPYNIKQLKKVLDNIGNLTVLVATEDEHFKERMLEVLDEKGYHSVVINNCKNALQKILDSSFDLILFDP